MADYKQCTDKGQTGPGVNTPKSWPNLSDPKGPALKGSVEQKGVPTNKVVRE